MATRNVQMLSLSQLQGPVKLQIRYIVLHMFYIYFTYIVLHIFGQKSLLN